MFSVESSCHEDVFALSMNSHFLILKVVINPWISEEIPDSCTTREFALREIMVEVN